MAIYAVVNQRVDGDLRAYVAISSGVSWGNVSYKWYHKVTEKEVYTEYENDDPDFTSVGKGFYKFEAYDTGVLAVTVEYEYVIEAGAGEEVAAMTAAPIHSTMEAQSLKVAPATLNTGWDWTKLTDTEKKTMKAYYHARKENEVIKLHNEKKLSSFVYCCRGKGAMNHVKDAIEKGII